MQAFFNLEDFGKSLAVTPSDKFNGNGSDRVRKKKKRLTRIRIDKVVKFLKNN